VAVDDWLHLDFWMLLDKKSRLFSMKSSLAVKLNIGWHARLL
jgi:hypothetical protein